MSATEQRGDRAEAFSRFVGRVKPRVGAEERMVKGALCRMYDRRRRRRRLAGGLAAAALAAGIGCVVWLSRTPPTRPAQGSDAPARVELRSSTPKTWTTTARPARHSLGPHRADLSTRTVVEVTSSSSSAARLLVRQGEAEFAVQPLSENGSFVVRTRHVEVAVLGTRFSVASDERCSRVHVRMGEVRVTVRATSETQKLGAGMEQSFCDHPTLVPGPLSSRGPIGQELGKGGMLVREALTLLAAGKEPERVERLLTRYMKHHAEGPFAEEAMFHLIHVKSRRGQHAQARKLAGDFLRRFPDVPRAARLRRWLESDKDRTP
jgi:FecR protein